MSDEVYLDDIEVGQVGLTSRRTITEADIVNFASVSGDFNALHTDEVFVREATPFHGRVAHGMLILSISNGLRSEVDRWKLIAFLEVQRRFLAPVYPGDTVHGRWVVEDVKPSKSHPERGVVRLGWETLNQDGDVVQTGVDVLMVACRDS